MISRTNHILFSLIVCQSSKFYPATKVKNEKLSIVNFSNSCENMGVKTVETIVESKWQSEGRGARVRRSIGRPELRNLDPFLMLDEFAGNANDGAGFPDHPHRGFETVSYLLEGLFVHEDFLGNKGLLKAGGLQWMTAGKGVIHSEMPGPVDTRGLQLWVNLKKEFKMVDPSYQELEAKDIPVGETNGVHVKVIAGESMGIKSPVRTLTPTYYLDFTLKPGTSYCQAVPQGWTTFLYTLEGEIKLGSDKKVKVKPGHTVVLSKNDEIVQFENANESEARFVLISGQPLNEPIVQHGPFVMNTKEEIAQTFRDYQEGKNGFEKAHEWRSREGNR